MKKLAYAAIAATMAVTLAGCANSETQSQESTEQQQQQTVTENQAPEKTGPIQASIGDTIDVSTDYGDIAVTIDGFVFDDAMASSFAEYGQMQEGRTVGLLQMTVENVSFDYDDYDGIPLSDFVYAEDSSGVAMTVMSSAINNGNEYQPIAGGYYSCQQGKTMRVAIPYVANPEMTEVTAVVGDYEVPVQIS